MRLAVVTPYFREPIETLRRCHDSVAVQSRADVVHILVADGHPRPEIDGLARCQHIPLPVGHGDSGDAPRLVGCASAAAQMFDGVLLLDADNWYEPEHVETLLAVQRDRQVPLVTAARRLIRPDTGESLGVCSESDGERFTDTNCYLVMHPAYFLFAAWGLRDRQKALAIGSLGDRLFWQAVTASKVPRAHSPAATVNYETAYAVHYLARGLALPAFAKVNVWMTAERRYRLVPYREYRDLVAAGATADQGF
ncbi:MAG: glycosyltransferase [Rhodospirillales bacterium]